MVKKKTTKKKGGAVSKRRINVKKTIAKFNKNSKKPYCGSKPAPAGRPRGSSNYCYRSGLRSGFKAGIDKQKKKQQGSRVASDAAERARTIRGLEGRMYLTKRWFVDNIGVNTRGRRTGNVGDHPLNIGVLRKINTNMGGDTGNQGVRKEEIIQRLRQRNWNRIALRDLL